MRSRFACQAHNLLWLGEPFNGTCINTIQYLSAGQGNYFHLPINQIFFLNLWYRSPLCSFLWGRHQEWCNCMDQFALSIHSSRQRQNTSRYSFQHTCNNIQVQFCITLMMTRGPIFYTFLMLLWKYELKVLVLNRSWTFDNWHLDNWHLENPLRLIFSLFIFKCAAEIFIQFSVCWSFQRLTEEISANLYKYTDTFGGCEILCSCATFEIFFSISESPFCHFQKNQTPSSR